MAKTMAAICFVLLLARVAIAQGAFPNMGSRPQNAEPSEEGGPTSDAESWVSDETIGDGCAPCNSELGLCNGCLDPRPKFYFTAESLFLNLNPGTRHAEPVVLNQDTQQTVLSTQSVDYDMVAGPRLAFGYRLNRCATVEATYFGLHDWSNSATAFGNNNLRVPGDLAFATQDFFDSDRMRINSNSRLNNAEINYFRRTGFNNIALLAGFRYLNLDETFSINASDIDAGQSSDYNIRATNRLYGAQFGGRWQKRWDAIGLDFIGKAGIFGNCAKQQTFVGDFDNTFVLRNSSTSGSRAAFVGELGLNGTCQLTKAFYARVGYTLLWVEGLARAMDQLDFTDTPQSGTALVFGNGAFMHGVSVGLEARW